MKERAVERVISESSQKEEIDLTAVTDLLDSLKLFTLSSSQISNEKRSDLLHNLVQLSFLNLKIAMPSLDCKQWPDDIVADLFKEIMGIENMSSAKITYLINAATYTKITDLTSTAPRLLMDSIISIAKCEGKSVIDGLVLPLLFQSDLKRPQTEVIVKIISESLNASQRLLLLQAILSDGEMYFNHENVSLTSRRYLRPWNDLIFQILNSILSTQPFVALDKTCLFDLVQPIQTVVQTNPKDKSSMQLLLLLTSKYPQALVEFGAIDTIDTICQSSTMFLKRAVLAQITTARKNLQAMQQQRG
ncbi:uncharacterized protein EV154DRAFT_122902 [Mucor mucedo]|uniref:uncharacterized protein n=1 Tax=Mucor mucedo TaxID=29922 RepID=UPI00221EAB49|nr:uncharacterized protein EV154DRAFT_122902 [Mucor mucedo]KAI7870508.1 hypothetical protein EV154DRAFT_122902 [Mucor mucedo]